MIERQLRQAGVEAEVLRFGMDGAPLSQYLNVLRREVRAFKPDVVLVQLIHNDFDEFPFSQDALCLELSQDWPRPGRPAHRN